MELHVLPGVVSTWREFCESPHAGSIALDGFVKGPPRTDLRGRYINFDHHHGVSRLETRATCAQVLMAIRLGLMRSGPWKHVWVNDCDEDVCLSWWLLKHHYLVDHQNPIINRLVSVCDMLDATGGAFPFPVEMPVLQQIAWVFDPYRRARETQGNQLDAHAMRAVITDVEQRIMRHVVGSGDSLPVVGEYHVGARFNDVPCTWALIDYEYGAFARNVMAAEGLEAFVSHRQLGSTAERRAYVIGRLSPFVDFPVQQILTRLNELEPGWGGGNMIGGSPRPDGSTMRPDEVVEVIEKIIAARP